MMNVKLAQTKPNSMNVKNTGDDNLNSFEQFIDFPIQFHVKLRYVK